MIIADFGVSASNPSLINPSTNAKTYFPALTLSTPSISDATGQLVFPSGYNGQRVKVVLAGDITTGDSINSTIVLQANTGTLSSPVYTTLALAAYATVAAETFPWFMVAEFEGTTAANSIGGSFTAYMNNTRVEQVLSTQLIVDPNLGFGLVAYVRFSAGNAGNAASLHQFQILSE